ncbi:MAG TPA: class I SAM-dependent methyltransferase [Acidimicrobiales bacterium]
MTGSALARGALPGIGPWPEAIFHGTREARLHLVDTREVIALPVNRWHGPMLPEEATLLESVTSPILDIGCGPGRHTAALARAGFEALGIDTSPAAVRAARRRGASVMQVSVFGAVPDAGRWATVLLLDGNIGIGGDPIRLLERVHALSAPGGRVLVEVDPPGTESRRFHAQVEHAGGLGPGFPWACVGAGGIRGVASRAGFRTIDVTRGGERWFAELQK